MTTAQTRSAAGTKGAAMIKIYPTKIEAIDDETSELMFTMETFDSECAVVEMKATINRQNMEKILTAVRSAVQMLDLEDGKTS